MKRLYRVAWLLLMLLSLVMVAQAQDATPEAAGADFNLTYSVPAQGAISNAVPAQQWTLETISADRLSVRVERISGNLIPDVAILDANLQQLQSSYGPDRTSAAAEIENFTLPAAGAFTVQVQRKDGANGVTEGKYRLVITPLATGEDNPNNTTVLGDIVIGEPISSELTSVNWYQRYNLTAQGEDVISVSVQRVSGTLFPEVEILDANGQSVAIGYTDRSGELAQIEYYQLPGPGAYTVGVTRQSRFTGNSVGVYQLSVTLDGAGEDNPLLGGTVGEIEYGADLTGEVNARWYQDWTLTTQAGDVITVTVTRASGNLQPEVVLLGGSGQELSRGYSSTFDGFSAVIERYELDGAGSYIIRVGRASGKSGVTTGSYNLRVDLNGSGEGSPTLVGETGTVELGQAVEGELTDSRWLNSWSFSGTEGQPINVLVNRSGGTLVPLVEIRDSNGQTLTSAYYEVSQDSAVIRSYRLPGTGTYQIVVLRDGQARGFTSGAYSLRVEADE